MKRRVFAGVLAAIISITSLTPPVLAADYRDVSKGAWYYTAVETCHDKGLIYGVSDAHYSPETAATRAMLVTVLGRTAERIRAVDGEPYIYYIPEDTPSSLYDLDPSAKWCYHYMYWAYEAGIIQETRSGHLSPDATVNREELAVMICNLARVLEIDLPPGDDRPADLAEVSREARASVIACWNAGIMSGYEDGSFRPGEDAQRAHMAQAVCNLMEVCALYVLPGDAVTVLV